MVWVGIRAGLTKLVFGPGSSVTSGRHLLKSNSKGIFAVQSANIAGRALRGDKPMKRPPPYPYKTKRYTMWHAWLLDSTTQRLNENSKIIVVEGPIASGKTAFAKTLAEDLDMLHMPEPTMDDIYINSYCYDLRKLDPDLPETLRSFDEKDFCLTPNDKRVATFQIKKYMLRYTQYIDALAHLMNTGQGVVLERCCYSDFVFLEAMCKSGYISKGAHSVYYDLRSNTIGELMLPHLVIYLDMPVPVVQEKIKARCVPHEMNSKVLTTRYLTYMEQIYKTRYLKEISSHAELLVYDWSSGGDVEVVVEDIERIDFDRFDKWDPKMKDWRLVDEWEWNNLRIMYTDQKDYLLNYFNVPRYDVPELVADGMDCFEYRKVMEKAPGMKFDTEFNADMGDRGLLFKTRKIDYRSLKGEL